MFKLNYLNSTQKDKKQEFFFLACALSSNLRSMEEITSGSLLLRIREYAYVTVADRMFFF